MPRTKNNFLNAKPVSKMGGKSGGVRKPSKPYPKAPKKKVEPPARWSAKTKTERLKEAAKTKPKSPAPKQVRKNPVTRTGPVKGPVPPKGSSSVSMPNSRHAGVNLPKTGARAERTATRVHQLKSAAKTASKAAPQAAAKTAGRLAGAAKGAGRIALPLAIGAQIGDVMRVSRQNKRWNEYKERMGMNQKPNSTKRRDQDSGNKPRSTDMKPKSDWRDKVSSSNVDKLRQGQNDTIRSYAGKTPATKPKPQPKAPAGKTPATKPKPQPKAPARTSERASAPARTSSSSRTSSAPAKPRFKGSIDEGRRIWAEKYSSSKYDGQAIQKEAKKLLDEMKKRKSGASKAGWDGNKNY